MSSDTRVEFEACSKEVSRMIKFGDRVSITEKLERRVRVKPNGEYKAWLPVPFNADDCIFLGYRTLTNGYRDYDYEEGYQFKSDEKFTAALVSPSINLSPVYVPIDSMELINQ